MFARNGCLKIMRPCSTVRAEIHRAPRRGRKFFFAKAALRKGGTKVSFTPRTGSNPGQAVFFLIARVRQANWNLFANVRNRWGILKVPFDVRRLCAEALKLSFSLLSDLWDFTNLAQLEGLEPIEQL